MSHKKHRRKDPGESSGDYCEPQMAVNHQIQKKRSLGVLRKNEKTKPRSPDATGKLRFQRHTLREIYRQLTDGDDEVICSLACWRNSDQRGPYLTVEISPLFVSFERRRSNGDAFYDMFNEEDK